MSNPATFRVWLKRRRQERGLTQEQRAELVGYSGQMIAQIESGRRHASPQLALRLAEVLQLAPEAHAAWMAAARADSALGLAFVGMGDLATQLIAHLRD